MSSSIFYTICILGSLYYLKFTNPNKYQEFESSFNSSTTLKLSTIIEELKLQEDNSLTLINLPSHIQTIYNNEKTKKQASLLYEWSKLFQQKFNNNI